VVLGEKLGSQRGEVGVRGERGGEGESMIVSWKRAEVEGYGIKGMPGKITKQSGR